MKITQTAVMWCAAASLTVYGAETRMGYDGSIPFLIGDWSAPKTVMAKSSDGAVSLECRICQVTVQYRERPETLTIEQLTHPTSQEMWIGEPAEHYVVIGPKIWGLRCMTVDILAQPSEPRRATHDGRELVVENFMDKFVKEPRSALWGDGGIRKMDARRIFGDDAFRSDNPIMFDIASVSAVEVGQEGVTVTVEAALRGQTMSLTLGRDFEVISASREGRPVYVLDDSSPACVERRRWWGPPGNSVLPSPEGNVPVIRMYREYTSQDPSGENRRIGAAMAVLVMETGQLWIGPDCCSMGVFGGRILGVKQDEAMQNLLVFTGPRAVIPLSPESRKLFWVEITKFEAEMEARQNQFKPDLVKSVSELLADDLQFPAGTEFMGRGCSVLKDGLLMRFYSMKSQAYPEILIGPDLTMVSPRVVTQSDIRRERLRELQEDLLKLRELGVRIPE